MVFGLVPGASGAASPGVRARLRDLTIAWSRYGYHGEILEASSVDDLLTQALERDASWCFVQTWGNILTESWPRPGAGPERFEDQIGGVLKDVDVLVLGREDERCFVVDLGRYASMGCPPFESLPVHDAGGLFDRTTTWLAPEDLEHCRGEFLADVHRQLSNATRGIFLWNVEPYDDVSEPPDAFVSPVSTLYSVASGFKPNFALEALGFDADTRIVFFDYSEQALAAKRMLLEQWDGEDFPRFLAHLFGVLAEPEAFYQLWTGSTPAALTPRELEDAWASELERWGGEAVFRRHWQRYRGLHHEFVRCDVLGDSTPLFERVAAEPDAVIWWSNAFFTVSGNWLFDTQERWRRYGAWIDALAGRNTSLFLYGSDPSNTAVNHIQAGEYRELLAATPTSDLKPMEVAQCQIRF